MSTLYRKYRPQNFEEIVGQNHIKIILQHELVSGKLAHAYLFCGPRAVGKTTFARVIAKAVNCTTRKEGEYEPCGVCDNCREITAGSSLDMVEIDAASHTGVDNVRENIIASARVTPSRLKKKVFIIDEVHMLSTQAFNALLKTLEEPPANVIFILCTTEIHKVPATIISRCQRFDFKRISLNEIVKKLSYISKKEDIRVDKGVLEAVARHADGHMRDAESILGQLVTVGGREISKEEADLVISRSDLEEVINLIDQLADKDAASGIRLVNRLLDEGVDLKVFLSDLVEMLRKLLITKINPGLAEKLGLELGEALELKLVAVDPKLSLEQLVMFLEQFSKVINELKGSFIMQLPVELAIVRLCSIQAAAKMANPSASPAPALTAAAQTKESYSKNQELPRDATASAGGPSDSFGAGTGSVTYEQVLEKWNELLVRVKKYNHSLSFILRVCQPKSLNGNELCLAFKYKFHKDRVNDPSIKSLIEKVIKETYNSSLTVEAIIDENLEVEGVAALAAKSGAGANEGSGDDAEAPQSPELQAENGNPLIDDLLKNFGGRVVG